MSPEALTEVLSKGPLTLEYDGNGPADGNPNTRCGRAGGALGTVSAFAPLDQQKVHWCAGKKLSDSAIASERESAQNILFHAVTNVHEGLHGVGLQHDRDEAAYTPCRGTSFSAIVAVGTYECQQSWCQGLRNLALAEFELEMDYSLGNDSRRNEGLCAEWTEKMGI